MKAPLLEVTVWSAALLPVVLALAMVVREPRQGGHTREGSTQATRGVVIFDYPACPSTLGGPKKSDPVTECLGRGRGGVSTKIHACTDALGNAVRLLATGGQAGDGPQALSLLAGLEPGKVLADTAYDSDENRAYCPQHPIEAVIPNRPNRLEPAELDEEIYRERNKIERFFGRLKQYRRLATRYEKTVVSFLALWHIAAALDWLR